MMERIENMEKIFKMILGLDCFGWETAYITRAEAEYYSNYCNFKSTGGI